MRIEFYNENDPKVMFAAYGAESVPDVGERVLIRGNQKYDNFGTVVDREKEAYKVVIREWDFDCWEVKGVIAKLFVKKL